MAARRQIRVGRKVGNKKPSFPGFREILCLTPSTPYGDIGPYVLRDAKGIMENQYQAAKVYIRTPAVRERYSQWDPTIIWERGPEVHVISEYDLPDDFDDLGYVELTNSVPGIEGAAFLTPAYFQWRKDLMECPYPVRYPVGMKHRKECIGIIPEEDLSSPGPLTMLSYIEGRKHIYVPIYQSLVLKSPKFKKLLDIYKNHDILIIEVDGPHQESLEYYKLKYGVRDDFIVGDTMLCTPENLDIMLNDSKHPYGHGYALADLILKTT